MVSNTYVKIEGRCQMNIIKYISVSKIYSLHASFTLTGPMALLCTGADPR